MKLKFTLMCWCLVQNRHCFDEHATSVYICKKAEKLQCFLWETVRNRIAHQSPFSQGILMRLTADQSMLRSHVKWLLRKEPMTSCN